MNSKINYYHGCERKLQLGQACKVLEKKKFANFFEFFKKGGQKVFFTHFSENVANFVRNISVHVSAHVVKNP